jgi:hypothetical protein
MRPVHQHRHAARPARICDLAHREDERGLGRDVVHEDESRPRRERFLDGANDRVRMLDGMRQRRLAHGRARAACDVARRLRDAAVSERRGHDLVPGPEIERAEHGVGSGGRVLHEREIGFACVDEARHLASRGAEQGLRTKRAPRVGRHQVTQKELGRSPLDLVPDLLLRLEHAARRRADRAVVQVGDVGIEKPLAEHSTAEVHRGPPRVNRAGALGHQP